MGVVSPPPTLRSNMGKKFTQEDRDRMASVGINSEGYKTSSQTTRKGRGTQTEHFNGRVDAHISPKPVQLKARKTGDR